MALWHMYGALLRMFRPLCGRIGLFRGCTGLAHVLPTCSGIALGSFVAVLDSFADVWGSLWMYGSLLQIYWDFLWMYRPFLRICRARRRVADLSTGVLFRALLCLYRPLLQMYGENV